MKIISEFLNGACLIELFHANDNRGTFVKPFNNGQFKKLFDESFDIEESFYSLSNPNVIRGMHFQLPPHDHAKIVFCPTGAIVDVILDIRKGSPTYGQYRAEVLSEYNNRAFYIPSGFAHGFKSIDDSKPSLTYYLLNSGYAPNSDSGIRYDSFGYDWSSENAIISDRDKELMSFADFNSPF